MKGMPPVYSLPPHVRPPRGLVLGRHVGESVKISDTITVTVVEVKGSLVKLCFDAPREVEVHRQEVWDRIQQEKGDISEGY